MLLYETAEDGTLSVAGVQAPEAALVIPAMQDGKPVRRILKNSLRELPGVRSIQIADSVTEIGDFACYASPDLIRVSLSETLTELGDGVFRGCEALQSVHYAAPQGNFYALRALLTEPEPAFRCELKLSDGEAELYFPSFLNEFDEDTMARAIHPRIEGCGYAFRECVTRRSIDFYQYDRQFARGGGGAGTCLPHCDRALALSLPSFGGAARGVQGLSCGRERDRGRTCLSGLRGEP